MAGFIKRFVIYLFLITLLCITGLMLSLLFAPQLLVNTWTVSKGLAFADRYITSISWQELHVEASSAELLVKKIAIQLDDLCVKEKKASLCGRELSIQAHVNLRPGKWLFPQLGPVRILGVTASLDLPEADEQAASEPEAAEPLRVLRWLETLEEMTIEPIHIEVDKLLLSRQQQELLELTAKLSLTGLHRHRSDASKRDNDQLNLVLNGRFQDQPFQLTSRVDIRNYAAITDQNAQFQARLNGFFAAHKLDLDISFDPISNSPARRTKAAINYRSDIGQVLVSSVGRLEQGKFAGQIDTEAKGLMEKLVNIDFKPCHLSVNWGERLSEKIALQMKCSGMTTREARARQEAVIAQFLPQKINFNLSIDADYEHGNDGDAYQLLANLSIPQFQNGGISLSGLVDAGIRKSKQQSQANIELELDIEAAIREFGELVNQLADTDWAIPAPANQLRGSTSCKVKGRYVSTVQQDQFPLACDIDLSSKMQAIQAEMEGQLILLKNESGIKPHLDAGLLLSNIQIALPEFHVGQSIPQLAPDQRFIMEEPPRRAEQAFAATGTETEANLKSQAEPAFSYNIRVRSAHSNAILIHSNLLKRPLPLAANVDLSSEYGMEGSVSLNNYELSLFRREALVDHVMLEFHRNRTDHPLSGRVVFDTRDYTIQLNIVGTAESPTFVLESSPPLPEKDLYGILLFGAQPEALSTDKARSLDETRAAIADGALSLLSMYYLASTPIESVGYNPHDGMFTARVALQEDLTLTIGTDAGQQGQLGLRKRIGQNWSIETQAIRGQEGEMGRAIAMLRWGLRY